MCSHTYVSVIIKLSSPSSRGLQCYSFTKCKAVGSHLVRQKKEARNETEVKSGVLTGSRNSGSVRQIINVLLLDACCFCSFFSARQGLFETMETRRKRTNGPYMAIISPFLSHHHFLVPFSKKQDLQIFYEHGNEDAETVGCRTWMGCLSWINHGE